MSNQSLVPCAHYSRNRIWLAAVGCAVLALLGLYLLPGASNAQVLYGSLTGNMPDPSKASVPSSRAGSAQRQNRCFSVKPPPMPAAFIFFANCNPAFIR